MILHIIPSTSAQIFELSEGFLRPSVFCISVVTGRISMRLGIVVGVFVTDGLTSAEWSF